MQKLELHQNEIMTTASVWHELNFEISASVRNHLVTQGSLPALAEHSKKHFKKLFGRSLQLHHILASGCNACEADLNVLATPFFDLARFGINFERIIVV